jgi:hypothetical protein
MASANNLLNFVQPISENTSSDFTSSEISESEIATLSSTATAVRPLFENEHLLDLGYAKDNVGSISVERLRPDFTMSHPP